MNAADGPKVENLSWRKYEGYEERWHLCEVDSGRIVAEVNGSNFNPHHGWNVRLKTTCPDTWVGIFVTCHAAQMAAISAYKEGNHALQVEQQTYEELVAAIKDFDRRLMGLSESVDALWKDKVAR